MELNLKDVEVVLSKTPIVKNISLKVKNNEFVGIIGPNGCGKSTLLKSVYKVLKPSKGEIYLDNMNLTESNSKVIFKRMAVVGQFNELNFDFSVFEMVMMGRNPHKKMLEIDKKIDYEIVDKALIQVDMLDYKDRSYMTLSGGEKQRVILARAIAQQPSFLVLDEPTNHLDIKYQLQILSIVKSMKIGALAALHDLSLAATWCSYLYVMKNGKIKAQGIPKKILTKELVKEVYEIDCEIYENPITKDWAIAYL